MGNLIKDFWTYSYKDKQYFGIVEVIKGNNLAQQRNKKVFETHIEKAIDYAYKNDVLSHISIQTFSQWRKDNSIRDTNEDKYYPFIAEFEAKSEKNPSEYYDAVYNAALYVNYLNKNLHIREEDILIMINNSKSVYVAVNPKTYGLKPHKKLNEIYTEMFNQISKEIGLDEKYIDYSIIRSTYKLMKTPNSYYKGGYQVRISFAELTELMIGVKTKEELTKVKRNINIEVPGQLTLGISKVYNKALKKINNYKEETKKREPVKCGGTCVEYMIQHFMEKGTRNYALVSYAIYLKSLGYTEDEVFENIVIVAESWNHDESHRQIRSKVRSVFRNDYNFSCNYARAVFEELGIENICSRCKYGCKNKEKEEKSKDGIFLDQYIINKFWNDKAATRHYKLYIELLRKDLFNKEFKLSEIDTNKRTIDELKRWFIVKRNNDKYLIEYKQSNNVYYVPEAFITNTMDMLGDSIKHYLRMLCKGYKAEEKYILFRSKKENLMIDLGYKNISSLYKLLKKFEGLGLIKVNKKSIYTLYFESYKVINIKEKQDQIVVKKQENTTTFCDAIGYEQIEIKDINICGLNNNLGRYRGSPMGPPD